MPFLGATLFATLCGWLVDSVLSSFASMGVRLMIGFVVSTIAFYWALRFLKDLRGR
jgi:hypothetical protein